MGPIKYLLQKYLFSLRALITQTMLLMFQQHKFLLHILHVYGFSPVWNLSKICSKNTYFRSELLKHTTFVIIQQQKFCCISCTCIGFLQYGTFQKFTLNKQLIQKHHKLFDLFLSSLPLRTSQYGTEEVIIKKESDILCMSDIKRGAPRI